MTRLGSPGELPDATMNRPRTPPVAPLCRAEASRCPVDSSSYSKNTARLKSEHSVDALRPREGSGSLIESHCWELHGRLEPESAPEEHRPDQHARGAGVCRQSGGHSGHLRALLAEAGGLGPGTTPR